MSDYLSRRVSLFHSAKNTKPVDEPTIEEVIRYNQDGKYRKTIDTVRLITDKKQRNAAKERCAAVTFSGTFSHRKESGLKQHSGLIRLDYDGISDGKTKLQKKAALSLNPHTLAAIDSISGPQSNGLTLVVPIYPVPKTIQEHKYAFEVLKGIYNLPEFDEIVKNWAWLTYVSHDPDLYLNPEAEPVEIDYSCAFSISANPSERTEYNEKIPDGQKYKFAGIAGGSLRRLHLGPEIIYTGVKAILEEYGETPIEDYDKLRILCEDIGTKPVDKETSWQSFVREASLEGAESAESADSAECSTDSELQEGLAWIPFPTDLLPAACADFVRAGSAALGCDEAMIAVPSLSVLAAAIANARRIRIKISWEEPSILWTILINPSGTLKTPAFDLALKPVNKIEMEAKQRFDLAWDQYEYELEQYNQLSKDAKRNAQVPQKPERARCRVSDTTVESVAVVHQKNPRGLLLARDELAGWFGSFDRYARGEADMQSWIEFGNGRFVQIDRKSGDIPTLDIERPHVCVTGTIQPKILSERLKNQHFDSGFIQRCLLAYPPESPRHWTEADITLEVRERYYNLVSSLYALPYEGEPRYLTLSAEAKREFSSFVNENGEAVSRMREGALRSTLSKIEAVAARFALIFQVAESTQSTEVSGEMMKRGILLAKWFRYEIARIYDVLGFEEKSLSRDEKLTAELPESFTWRNVVKLWGVQRRASFDIIRRLVEKGLIEEVARGSYRKTALCTSCTICTLDTFSSDGAPGPDEPLPRIDEAPF